MTQADERRLEPLAAESQRPPCQCESFARVTEHAALGRRALARTRRQGGCRGGGVLRRAARARAAAGRRPHRDRRAGGAAQLVDRHDDRRGRRAGRPRSRPARGAGGRRPRRHERDLDDRRVARAARCRRCPRCTCGRWPSARRRAAPSRSSSRSATTSARSPTSYGRMVNDITAIVLDRPRHHDLIEDIRASGARIKLIQDGDVTASISAAVRGTNDHLAIGIGGTRQAVLARRALCAASAASCRRSSGRRAAPRSKTRARTGSRTSSGCSRSTISRRRR